MRAVNSKLDQIDLGTNSRKITVALVELLTPHTPHSLSILGIVLNTGSRAHTLQNIDPSQISLWSTIPLCSNDISTTDPFSVVVFSHLDHQFRLFCSVESKTSDDPLTEPEEAHVKQVFEHLQEIARDAWPTYDSALVSLGSPPRKRIGMDPSMIVIGAVHAKWAHVLAPISTSQNPVLRYVFPPGESSRTPTLSGMVDVEVSKIRASDLPFVHGASSIPRSDGYILSRAPYSVCLRLQTGKDPDLDGEPVACALMHFDGSIGALHVDPKYRHQGLGRLVIQALMETLVFGKGVEEVESSNYRDLGGGALGWNWTDVTVGNEVGNRFFASLVGKENAWTCHWTYILVDSLGMLRTV